jgi:hypothetical protein
VTDVVLCTPGGIQKLDTRLTQLDCKLTYKDYITKFVGTIKNDTDIVYESQTDGVCGSPLMTLDGYLVGHHVAAVFRDEEQFGCAKLFSQRSVDKIRELFSQPYDYAVQINKNFANGSITRIDDKVYHHINTKTSYVKSKVHGVFPVERAPANLDVYGKDTIHILSEKSRKPVQTLDLEGLNYATTYLEAILPQVQSLSDEKTLVLGDENIGKIDKNTSVGYGLDGKKDDYLDFESGRLLPTIRQSLHKFVYKVVDGSYRFDTYYAETLKDELKNLEKVNKPRVFKAGPLTLTLLYRFFFGNMISQVSKDRMSNGIMVGINPLSSEWDKFARRLSTFSTDLFDGDWGDWDGGMVTTVQQNLCHVFKDKIKINYSQFNVIFDTKFTKEEIDKVFDVLLVMMYMTPTITGDKAYITTHSMPSGNALTAFFNSCVNKCYGAYVFFYLSKQRDDINVTVEDYIVNVFDAVYGDDKLTAVKPKVATWFNGKTFSQVATTMGLRFTPADKGDWTYTTRSLFECSFLKRGFKVHPLLRRVVAPLELLSMKSTLNYVSDNFRNDELTVVKLQNFQREAFLHYEDYLILMERVFSFCQERDIFFTKLSDKYLMELYEDGIYASYLELH